MLKISVSIKVTAGAVALLLTVLLRSYCPAAFVQLAILDKARPR